MAKQYFHNQEVLFITEHFDKTYFWLKDGDGTHYMLPARQQVTGYSVDAEGNKTPVLGNWEPVFA